jgi:hypothetical protein
VAATFPFDPNRSWPTERPERWRSAAPGLAALLGLGLLGLGCARERPWDGPADAGTHDESRPWLSPKPDASWLRDPDAGAGDAGSDGAAVQSPSPVGGLWVSCYGGFHPSDSPRKDVTRLGLLCGPPNGMGRANEASLEGAVDETKAPSTHRFQARRGECYRIFAVADRGVSDLNVAVYSSRGSKLATDHGEDRWPIVHPERPFCTFDDDTFAVHFRARRGAGRYAAEIWKLPRPK